jgi:hypothetical protein
VPHPTVLPLGQISRHAGLAHPGTIDLLLTDIDMPKKSEIPRRFVDALSGFGGPSTKSEQQRKPK